MGVEHQANIILRPVEEVAKTGGFAEHDQHHGKHTKRDAMIAGLKPANRGNIDSSAFGQPSLSDAAPLSGSGNISAQLLEFVLGPDRREIRFFHNDA